jgi:hypothetical protein
VFHGVAFGMWSHAPTTTVQVVQVYRTTRALLGDKAITGAESSTPPD